MNAIKIGMFLPLQLTTGLHIGANGSITCLSSLVRSIHLHSFMVVAFCVRQEQIMLLGNTLNQVLGRRIALVGMYMSTVLSQPYSSPIIERFIGLPSINNKKLYLNLIQIQLFAQIFQRSSYLLRYILIIAHKSSVQLQILSKDEISRVLISVSTHKHFSEYT